MLQVAVDPLPLRSGHLRQHRTDLVLDVDARVPEIHRPHGGEVPHRLAVRPADFEVDAGAHLRAEAALTARNRKAGGQALDVPFEWAGKRLVEVVEAEDQTPVRSREATEVGQMRVAAELRLQSRAGAVGEVGRHQSGRTPVEGERRDEHPSVPDRDQLRHA